MKSKPNRGTETWRRMNNSIRRGSESRSPQTIIATYCDLATKVEVKRLESFPERQRYRGCPTGMVGLADWH